MKKQIGAEKYKEYKEYCEKTYKTSPAKWMEDLRAEHGKEAELEFFRLLKIDIYNTPRFK